MGYSTLFTTFSAAAASTKAAKKIQAVAFPRYGLAQDVSQRIKIDVLVSHFGTPY
jgi:hypothetical protein